MKKWTLAALIVAVSATGSVLCSHQTLAGEKSYPPCPNKPSISVGDFRTENIYIGWDQFAGNARDVVIEELTNSGCFRVVERGAGLVAPGYDKEQMIKGTVARPGQKAAKSGNVTLSSRVVEFALTGVSANNVGGSVGGFGVGGGNFGLGSVAPRSSTIEMTCRMYDTSTIEVMAASRVKKSKFDIGVLGAGGGNIAFGGDFFYKTPVGKTIAGLIHDCAVDLAQKTQGMGMTE